MRRIYTPPVLAPRSTQNSTVLQNSSTIQLKNSLAPPHSSLYQPDAFRQYISRHSIVQPIRGRDLFIRSIRRVIEQIRNKKQRAKNDQQIFSTYQEAINIFSDLTFMKCVVLKKKLLDSNNRNWTTDFAREGGLHALLAYLEQITSRGLSLVDAILVNEALQCLRAMMNIDEIFEHIATNPQYIDSLAKVLSIPSAEIRMRVFELLTALCIYSIDGYELVLQALNDFQNSNKLAHVFVVVLEQLKLSVLPKHKWSAIALLNSILSATESIEKRLSFRNILNAHGLLSTLEHARIDNDHDLNVQIDIFFEEQKRDQDEFLGNLDPTDNQAVYQAIQLQLTPDSHEAALFLTSMQLLYSTLTPLKSIEQQKVLQGLLDYISHSTEKLIDKKTVENATQTEDLVKPIIQSPANNQQVPVVSKPPLATINTKPIDINSISLLINSDTSNDVQPPIVPVVVISPAPPPPPPLPPTGFTGIPQPPPPPPLGFSTISPPPPPPPPVGVPPPPLGQLNNNVSIVGLSAVIDSIPKPKSKVRRLQWKKLPQTILTTSQFWMEVNKKADPAINFMKLEDCFKVNNETSNSTITTNKQKATTILPCNRSIGINIFLKKFNFVNVQSIIHMLETGKSNQNAECFRMLLKILPSTDEISVVRDHPREQWTLSEEFVDVIASLSHYEFRVRTLILISEFDETFNDFKSKLENILKTIHFIQFDPSIKALARSILSIGDFLNYGSYAGNAFGFRLDIFNQLHDIRLTEHRTLLGILIETSSDHFKFIDELKPILADDIQWKSVKTDYSDWKKKIDDGFKQMNSIEDKQMIEQYKLFYENSSKKLNNILNPLIVQCENQENELMKQFGENDLNEFNYDTCRTIFRNLIEQVEKENKEREKRAPSNKILLNTKLPIQMSELTNKNTNKISDNHFMDSLMTEFKQKKYATVPVRRVRTRRGLFDNDERDVK